MGERVPKQIHEECVGILYQNPLKRRKQLKMASLCVGRAFPICNWKVSADDALIRRSYGLGRFLKHSAEVIKLKMTAKTVKLK